MLSDQMLESKTTKNVLWRTFQKSRLTTIDFPRSRKIVQNLII